MGCCHKCCPRARQICHACDWKMKAACGNYSNQTQNSRNGSAHARVWPARRTQRAVTFRCARAEHQVCSNPGALLAAQQAGLPFRFNWPLKDMLPTTSTQHGENFHQCMHKSTLHGEHVTHDILALGLQHATTGVMRGQTKLRPGLCQHDARVCAEHLPRAVLLPASDMPTLLDLPTLLTAANLC